MRYDEVNVIGVERRRESDEETLYGYDDGEGGGMMPLCVGISWDGGRWRGLVRGVRGAWRGWRGSLRTNSICRSSMG